MLSVLFALLMSVGFANQENWALPNTPSSGIGDMGSFYLSRPEFYAFHLMNNDFIGNTDKLMTGSTSLFYYHKLESYSNKEKDLLPRGMEISIHRRLITPILKTRFNTSELSSPQGFYADWLELRTAYSQHLSKRWKVEGSISLDDFGNFDGQSIQSRIHQIIGSPDESAKYKNRNNGIYGSGSLGLGYFVDENLLLIGYFQKNELMEAWDLRLSYMHQFEEVSVGAQINLVNQNYSDLYDSITQYRYDWGVSVKYGWWEMNLGYVSKYLKYDEYGQVFINPLIIHFKF